MASGEGLKVSLQAGFSLAQIGEFSFIIATLGNSLGVISSTLYPIIVAVSIITTFTTPYCIKLSTPFYNFLERNIPKKWNKLLTGYATSNYKTVNTQNDWNKILKSVLKLLAAYFTISLAIVFIAESFTTPFIMKHIPDIWGRILSALIALILMAPFLRAIVMKKNRSEEFKNLWSDNRFNRGALISLIAFRFGLCVVLVLMVLIPLFPRWTVLMVIISLLVITLIIFTKGFKTQSRRMEARFLTNFNQKQLMEEKRAAIHPSIAKSLQSKDIHLEEIEISPTSPKIGKSLRELNLRRRFGVSIVTILRGNKKINIPVANEVLYPYDKIIIAGSDSNIQKLIHSIEERKTKDSQEDDTADYNVNLSQYIIEPNSFMINKTIIELCIQEKTECMVICIDRGEKTIINIPPGFIFKEGDTLLLAGETEKLNAFEENMDSNKPLIT